MKKNLILIILLIKSICLNAQIIDLYSDFEEPVSIKLNGNYLFIADGADHVDAIYKRDITEPSSPAIEVVSGLNRVTSIALNGDYLYIAEFDANKISKINITETSPNIIDVITGVNKPSSIAFNGNDLYITEYGDKISKINITETIPTAVDVITELSYPISITFNGNDLYIIENYIRDKIFKFDITESSPTLIEVYDSSEYVGGHGTGLDIRSLLIQNNNLYFSDWRYHTIFKKNIIDTDSNLVEVVDNANFPSALLINGDDLYFTKITSGIISKINLTTLSLLDINLNIENNSIFPNPSKDLIKIVGITSKTKYVIYNSLGINVLQGDILNKDTINIQKLINGVYFIKFENRNSLKFIKKQ